MKRMIRDNSETLGELRASHCREKSPPESEVPNFGDELW